MRSLKIHSVNRIPIFLGSYERLEESNDGCVGYKGIYGAETIFSGCNCLCVAIGRCHIGNDGLQGQSLHVGTLR